MIKSVIILCKIMKRETAIKILEEVKANYDLIAENFSRTRHSVWNEFKPLGRFAQDGDKVLDLGCGNGRLIELFDQKIEYYGIDNAAALIAIAKQKYPAGDFRVFDGLKIPWPDNYFDVVYCIAVLHHIPGPLREEFLVEAKRVLKPGGQLIIAVYYLWQKDTYWGLLLKFSLDKILGKSNLDFFDIKEPFFKTAERYFHVFRKRELKELISSRGFRIKKAGVLRRSKGNKNLYVIGEKS